MTREMINTSIRDIRFGQRPGKNPRWGKPFEILLVLDCHKMFNREYNEPLQNHPSKLTQQHSEICSQYQYIS